MYTEGVVEAEPESTSCVAVEGLSGERGIRARSPLRDCEHRVELVFTCTVCDYYLRSVELCQ
eukprot:6498121-Prymnesium_polylepis.1